jgi:SAM-dependent methyltransferase
MGPVGYVTDTTYADTFFRELSPAWLNYVAALNGVRSRPIDVGFRYLELGCGFGTSSVINAAAFPYASFDAYDFNAAHVEGGRAYARELGLENIQFHTESFQELLIADLAPFDFIVMHGVYSWVDAATRAVLRQLTARWLRPGGLAYVSYNALPGWSAELPLRKLLVELSTTEVGTAAEASERATATIDALRRAGLRYFAANPAAKTAVDAYTHGEGRYLAHEFMNAAWEPFYAVDVADELSASGLRFVGSATLTNNHLPLMLDAAATEAIAALPSSRQQRLAIDFAINQRFRRDVFVRADDQISPRPDALDQTVIGCMTDVEEIGISIRVPRGEIRFHEPFISDVRTLFERGSWSFAHAVDRLSKHGQDRAAIARNLSFLVAGGALAPFARRCDTITATPTRLANAIVERAVSVAAMHPHRRVIPSAVAGNGVALDDGAIAALAEWSPCRPGVARHAQRSDSSLSRRLTTLARLGIVV